MVQEQVLGLEHPKLAKSLNNLARYYHEIGKYSHAAELCRRAQTIQERVLGLENPDVAESLNLLAIIHLKQGEFSIRGKGGKQQTSFKRDKIIHAKQLCNRALAIREHVLGPEHPDVAKSLHLLALLSSPDRAKQLCNRALAIQERVLGPEHPDVAKSLFFLAELFRLERRYYLVEPLYQRSIAINKQSLGPKHPDVINVQERYVTFLEKQNRNTEAAELKALVKAARIKEAPENQATKEKRSHSRKSAKRRGSKASRARGRTTITGSQARTSHQIKQKSNPEKLNINRRGDKGQ